MYIITKGRQRVVLIMLLILMTINPLFAQIGEYRNELSLGINAGVSLNTISFDPTIKQKQHIGPLVGLSFRYTCEKYFKTVCALQVELNYARLGWREDIRSSNDEKLADRYSRHQNYLQMPLLARLAWGKESNGFLFFILAGPQIGYCIGENTDKNDWTYDENGHPDRPNQLYAQYDMSIKNKFDYGITGGLGLELSTKRGHVLMEGRYYYGLSDIYGNSKKDVFSRSANGTIIAKVSYLFSLKKKT